MTRIESGTSLYDFEKMMAQAEIMEENLKVNINIDLIIKTVCEYFNIPIVAIKSKNRIHSIVEPRQIAMYLAKKYTKLSLSFIGKYFEGKDHATVLYSCDVVGNYMETEILYFRKVREIENIIEQRYKLTYES